jgi:hypothetical protein
MPIEHVPGTDLTYHLIAFDKNGRERTDDPDGLMSERALAVLRDEPVTDVFVISHGWQGDIPAARRQYARWIGAMHGQEADRQRMRELRPGFRVLIIGLHWPSLPFGDEEFGSPVASFATPEGAPDEEQFVDVYADRIADTPAAREALRTIFEAALENVAPDELPANVREAYLVLDREAGLGGEGPGGSPSSDREPFDPDEAYKLARDDAASFGGFGLGGLLSPLRQLSFWKMKDRAKSFGESGGFQLVEALQGAAAGRDVRFHFMGHSFGCIVVSATLAGPPDAERMLMPVHSAVLVQGALSFWSYCSDIPRAPGNPGYFRRLVDNRIVQGPIVTTLSEFDTAVGRFYPIGAGIRGDVVFNPGELPKYGGLGSFGAQGPDLDIADMAMLPADGSYDFQPGRIYNLESSAFIAGGGGASGAHSEIDKPEVAHAVWQAAMTGLGS